jgi:hypothetical protein
VKHFSRALFVLTASFLLVSMTNASPIFSINTQAEWQTALSSGQVSEVTSSYDALDHYGTEGIDYVVATPTLSALSNAQSGLGDGLQMEWGDDTQDLPQVAAWEYVYDADPNLNKTVLRLTITPPAGIPPGAITEISLTLTDTTGDWMSWFWDVIPPLPGPTGVPAGVSSFLGLDPTLHANQANSTSFTESIGGFNHTIALSIIADELAINPGPGGVNWTNFPSAPLSTGLPVWNYWSGLSVTPVPVPPAVWLFGSALGLLGWIRRKKAS